MFRIFCISFTAFFGIATYCYCQAKIEKEISYTSDLAFNLSGGIQTGSVWMGCFQASLGFDTEKINLWKNGKVKFSYISTHGKSLSVLTGDMQVISNIEAGPLSTALEFWYQHQIGKLTITAGFIDLNAFFSYSDQALSLINSSFGIQPTISGNMPVPIFPITSLGSVINLKLKNDNNLSFGIFDGSPGLYNDFQLTPDVKWDKNEGLLMVSEYRRTHFIGIRPGVIKTGIWIHTLKMQSHRFGVHDYNLGFYFIGEQELFNINSKKFHLWAKFGGAPKDCNVIRFFNGGGLAFTNYSGKNDNDVINLGFGQAIFCSEFHHGQEFASSETVIELTIHKEIGVFSVQPDIQYVIHPSGIFDLKNPICVIIRTSITL